MAKISVIVPVYKVEAYLKRCVDSILGQTYSDFELILVDDGSPDNCPQICDEYAEKDSRVRVIHQQNGGLSAARNAGIDWMFRNSDSEWFSFIDSDDYVHPRYLEVLLNAAESTGCDVSIGNYIEFSGDSVVPEENIAVPQKIETEKFFIEKNVNAIIACGKLYRRKCFEEIRYPLGKLHEDEFTTYKILFQKENISFIETPLYFYYQNPESITRKWTPRRLDAVQAIYEQIVYFNKNRFVKAYEWSCFHYIENIAGKLQNIGKQLEKDEIVLRKKLRFALKTYKHEAGVSFKTHQWIYWNAYPEYRLYFRIKNKLQKIIKLLKFN